MKHTCCSGEENDITQNEDGFAPQPLAQNQVQSKTQLYQSKKNGLLPVRFENQHKSKGKLNLTELLNKNLTRNPGEGTITFTKKKDQVLAIRKPRVSHGIPVFTSQLPKSQKKVTEVDARLIEASGHSERLINQLESKQEDIEIDGKYKVEVAKCLNVDELLKKVQSNIKDAAKEIDGIEDAPKQICQPGAIEFTQQDEYEEF